MPQFNVLIVNNKFAQSMVVCGKKRSTTYICGYVLKNGAGNCRTIKSAKQRKEK